jgi:CheY-like chemotaxis protein
MPILIIEDEPEIRFVISELLIDEGYTSAQAANGREALQADRLDLALIDL